VRTRESQAMRRVSHGIGVSMAVVMLLFVCAATGVAWVYTGMIAQERWPIKWLQIDGPFERVSAEQIRANLRPFVNDSFFTVDTVGMHVAVGNIPWVTSVAVQKTWPDTVHVTVREHMPVAHWIDGNLISTDGLPFKVPSADDIQGLPWLQSPPGQRQILFENWKKFDDALEIIGQHIVQLNLDPRGSWSAVLSGGTEVRFGKGDIFENLDMLVATWVGLMQGQELPPISIDLRYTNGFAVLWPGNVTTIAGNYGEES